MTESDNTSTRKRASVAKRLLFTTLIVAATALFADALLGIVLTVSRGASDATLQVFSSHHNLIPHPDYIWTYRPYSRVEMTGEGRTVQVSINRLGLRDEDETPEPYILALGDSLTYGWLVEQDETWHRQLARRLSAKRARPIHSVNLGMWMATFSQHHLRLKEMLTYYPHPRVVIHLVYPSHVQVIASHVLDFDNRGELVRDRSLILHCRDGDLYFGADEVSLVERDLAWPYIHFFLRRRAMEARFRDLYEHVAGPISKLSDLNLYTGDHADAFAEAWVKTEASLSCTAHLLKARGILYIVVLAPRDRQVNRAEWNDEPVDTRVLNSHGPQERLRALCHRLEVPCLDLLPAMRSADTLSCYYKFDPHWNPAGHAFVADRIREFLEPQALNWD